MCGPQRSSRCPGRLFLCSPSFKRFLLQLFCALLCSPTNTPHSTSFLLVCLLRGPCNQKGACGAAGARASNQPAATPHAHAQWVSVEYPTARNAAARTWCRARQLLRTALHFSASDNGGIACHLGLPAAFGLQSTIYACFPIRTAQSKVMAAYSPLLALASKAFAICLHDALNRRHRIMESATEDASHALSLLLLAAYHIHRCSSC